jgi:hypothetical protein
MTTAICFPQAPSLAKVAGGHAPIGVTAHDRARSAFQDVLRYKIEKKLERMERREPNGSNGPNGDARSRTDRRGAALDGYLSDAAVFERPARLGGYARGDALDRAPTHEELAARLGAGGYAKGTAPEAHLLRGLPPRNLGGGTPREIGAAPRGGVPGSEPPTVQMFGLGHAPPRGMGGQAGQALGALSALSALDAGFEGELLDAAVFERPGRMDRLGRRAMGHRGAEINGGTSAVDFRDGRVGTRPAFGAGPLSLSVEDGRFSRTELPGWTRGYIRDGFAVGPDGELMEGGRIVMGKNGPIIIGRRAPETAPDIRPTSAAPGIRPTSAAHAPGARRQAADALERLARIPNGVPLPFDEAGSAAGEHAPALRPPRHDSDHWHWLSNLQRIGGEPGERDIEFKVSEDPAKGGEASTAAAPKTLTEEFLRLVKGWKDREIEKRGEDEEDEAGYKDLPKDWLEVTSLMNRDALRAAQAAAGDVWLDGTALAQLVRDSAVAQATNAELRPK